MIGLYLYGAFWGNEGFADQIKAFNFGIEGLTVG
jgi:hypothetical protein